MALSDLLPWAGFWVAFRSRADVPGRTVTYGPASWRGGSARWCMALLDGGAEREDRYAVKDRAAPRGPRDRQRPVVRSPRILAVSWGRMEVEGIGVGKDFKLYPGGGREWDWDETGTRHSPGIQPADVAELLAHGAEVVVLSRGMYRRLQVDPRTLDLLARRSVTAHVAETREAVRIYNDLTDGAQVAGLFHSTC